MTVQGQTPPRSHATSRRAALALLPLPALIALLTPGDPPAETLVVGHPPAMTRAVTARTRAPESPAPNSLTPVTTTPASPPPASLAPDPAARLAAIATLIARGFSGVALDWDGTRWAGLAARDGTVSCIEVSGPDLEIRSLSAADPGRQRAGSLAHCICPTSRADCRHDQRGT